MKATAILPKCAAEIAAICAKEPGRFALHCVQIEVRNASTVVRASDGRILIEATYPSEEVDGSASFLVYGKDFAQALKGGRVLSSETPKDLARVVLGDDGSVTFDMPRWSVRIPPSAYGAFPAFDGIIPATGTAKGSPAGKPVGWVVNVVPRAMTAAAKAVGNTGESAIRAWPNGVNGPLRLDVTGAEGEAVVVWMPVALAGDMSENAPADRAEGLNAAGK